MDSDPELDVNFDPDTNDPGSAGLDSVEDEDVDVLEAEYVDVVLLEDAWQLYTYGDDGLLAAADGLLT